MRCIMHIYVTCIWVRPTPGQKSVTTAPWGVHGFHWNLDLISNPDFEIWISSGRISNNPGISIFVQWKMLFLNKSGLHWIYPDLPGLTWEVPTEVLGGTWGYPRGYWRRRLCKPLKNNHVMGPIPIDFSWWDVSCDMGPTDRRTKVRTVFCHALLSKNQ